MTGAEKEKALQAAGWKSGDAADFLGMTDDERRLLDARVAMARAIRALRAKMKMSQKDLALRLKTSQPRVAKIEQAASEVSFDLLFRAYAVMGGRIELASGNGKRRKKESPRLKPRG
jgi:DNA-binding transcriptional regulator YiaG